MDSLRLILIYFGDSIFPTTNREDALNIPIFVYYGGSSSITTLNETINVDAEPSAQPADPTRIAQDSFYYFTSTTIA